MDKAEFYHNCVQFIRELDEDGLLRPGLDVETAVQFYWAMQSADLPERFMSLGWTEERFVAMFYEVIGMLIMDRTYVSDVLYLWKKKE